MELIIGELKVIGKTSSIELAASQLWGGCCR